MMDKMFKMKLMAAGSQNFGIVNAALRCAKFLTTNEVRICCIDGSVIFDQWYYSGKGGRETFRAIDKNWNSGVAQVSAICDDCRNHWNSLADG